MQTQNGSVVLVALCFVAVLGIAITTYLTLSSRTMSLSARSYKSGLSAQLAEAGLERALSSLNSASWTGWSTSGTSATRTLTSSDFADYKMNITPSVKILVLNRDATTWSANTSYTVGQAAWQQGKWYQCISSHSNQPPPNKTYWICAPTKWEPTVTYYNDSGNKGDDMVIHNGTAYRCTTDNTNQAPPSASWTAVTSGNWSASTNYQVNHVAFRGGAAYRCINSNSGQQPPNVTYWVGAPAIYAEGIVATPEDSRPLRTQLRADFRPASLFVNALGGTNTSSSSVKFDPAIGTVDSYNSAINPGASSYTSPTQVGTLTNYSAVVAGPSVWVPGETTISGYVATKSFTTGLTTIVKGTSVTPSSKVDLSRISSNNYVPAFEVNSITNATNLPAAAGSGTFLYEGTINLGTAGASTPSVYNITATYDGGWPYSGLDLYDSSHVLNINGPVILNVTGMVRTRAGRINIASTGSLEIRFTGMLDIGNPSFASAGVINNTFDPKKCILVGTSTTNSSNSHYYRSRQNYFGVIYMPNAYVHLQNSNYTPHIYGAISAKTIYFQHSANIHYDVSLRNVSGSASFVDSPFQIVSWRELTDPTEQISL